MVLGLLLLLLLVMGVVDQRWLLLSVLLLCKGLEGRSGGGGRLARRYGLRYRSGNGMVRSCALCLSRESWRLGRLLRLLSLLLLEDGSEGGRGSRSRCRGCRSSLRLSLGLRRRRRCRFRCSRNSFRLRSTMNKDKNRTIRIRLSHIGRQYALDRNGPIASQAQANKLHTDLLNTSAKRQRHRNGLISDLVTGTAPVRYCGRACTELR